VVHCPYCHGWEFRDQAIGVLATGPAAVAAGTMAGAHINADLIAEETERAVAARRGRQPGAGVPR
jgi:thioredoxin reductase